MGMSLSKLNPRKQQQHWRSLTRAISSRFLQYNFCPVKAIGKNVDTPSMTRIIVCKKRGQSQNMNSISSKEQHNRNIHQLPDIILKELLGFNASMKSASLHHFYSLLNIVDNRDEGTDKISSSIDFWHIEEEIFEPITYWTQLKEECIPQRWATLLESSKVDLRGKTLISLHMVLGSSLYTKVAPRIWRTEKKLCQKVRD